MTRAAVYTRVSTNQQEEGTSLETQEDRCRAFAAERGYQVIDVHRDTYTGSEYRERPGLSALREQVRAGHIDVVVCYAVDRLSRNQAHLYIVAEEIDDHKARLEFVTEDFEDSAVGRFIRSARAFAAEVEREKTTERTTRGRKARVEAGKLIPSGRPLYGYQWADGEHTQLVVDPLTSLVVRRIYDDCLSGLSLRKIVGGLYHDSIPSPSGGTAWSLTSVSRILRHPNYTGTAYGWWGREPNGTVLYNVDRAIVLPEGTVPAIVSRDEWESAQQRMRHNQKFAARNNRNPEDALLRGGFVRCGYCGGVMVANTSIGRGRSSPRYQCNYRGMRPESEHRGVTIAIEKLDRAVWDRVTALLTNPDLIANEIEARDTEQPDGTDDLAALNAAINEIERQTSNIAQAIAIADDVAPLVARLNGLSERRRELEIEQRRIQAANGQREIAHSQLMDLHDWCATVAANLPALSYQKRRDLLLALNVSVRVYAADAPQRLTVTANVPLGAPIVLR